MKAHFVTDLVLRKHRLIGVGDTWSVYKPLIYYSVLLGTYILIEEGSLTNLGSIPWGFQWLVPKSGVYDDATVVHDDLYKKHSYQPCDREGNKVGERRDISRQMSDAVLKEAALSLGTNKVRANLLYAGPRVGGNSYWKSESKL